MNVLIGIFLILAHLVVGNVLSTLVGGVLPGSVIGMILLFLSLMTGIVKDFWIRKVATFFTDNMTIFFMPAFMGILDIWDIIKMNFVSWLAVIIISTALVMVTTGGIQEFIEKIRRTAGGRKEEE